MSTHDMVGNQGKSKSLVAALMDVANCERSFLHAEIDQLQVGDHVRIVIEGTVQEPVMARYEVENGTTPPISISSNGSTDSMVVLRYTKGEVYNDSVRKIEVLARHAPA